MPFLQTWQQAPDPADLYFNSNTIVPRNHHYPPGGLNSSNFLTTTTGVVEMTLAIEQYYPIPHHSDPVANFSSWCRTTRIFQADFYRTQITYYRRGSGFPERQLASLYWQLEGIWQAPTWAGIGCDGRWKVLHYVAKDIYQPIIIASYLNDTTGDLTADVTSDLWSKVEGTATFACYGFNGTLLSSPLPAVTFTAGALNTAKVL
jgi:beta-mannosidase